MINTIKDLRLAAGMTQLQFSQYFGFSKRALEEWEAGRRACPPYLLDLIAYKLFNEHLI